MGGQVIADQHPLPGGIEVWQRFARKWATCNPGQKPCRIEAQALLILKGF
jgi:hypothetical protein